MIVSLLLLRCVHRAQEWPEDTSEILLTVTFGMLRPQLLTAARPFALRPAS